MHVMRQAALQWVSRNIAAFGGDPKRVFLVGESAGAGSVSVHLASPASWPYFSRAGMESGAMSYWVAASMAAHEQQFSAVLESLDCESRASGVDCLLSKTTDELLNATVGPRVDMSVGGVEVLQTPFNPAIDGVVLTDAPWALGAAGKLAPVPVIAGSNRDEGASFIPSVLHCSPNCTVAEVRAWWGSTVGTAHVAQLEELYPFTGTDAPPPGGTQAWMAAQRSYGDYIMSCSARRLSRWVTASGHAAFLYLFTYISPARGAPPLVYHAADIRASAAPPHARDSTTSHVRCSLRVRRCNAAAGRVGRTGLCGGDEHVLDHVRQAGDAEHAARAGCGASALARV